MKKNTTTYKLVIAADVVVPEPMEGEPAIKPRKIAAVLKKDYGQYLADDVSNVVSVDAIKKLNVSFEPL